MAYRNPVVTGIEFNRSGYKTPGLVRAYNAGWMRGYRVSYLGVVPETDNDEHFHNTAKAIYKNMPYDERDITGDGTTNSILSALFRASKVGYDTAVGMR